MLNLKSEEKYPNIKSYNEVCCQYKRKKELLINLIIQANKKADTSKLESILKSHYAVFNKNNRSSLLEWPEEPDISTYRIKILLTNESLSDIEKSKEVKDPNLYPHRANHFEWFDKRLEAVAEVLGSELEK